jgi:hypothetical protein
MDFLIYEEKFAFFFYQCNKPAAAEDGIVRSSQLSSLFLGQAEQYVMAGGTAKPSQFKSSPIHAARQGRTH